MDYKLILTSTIIPAFAVLVIGLVAIKIIMMGLRTGLKKSKRVDAMLFKFINNAVRIILLILLAMLFINKLGVDTTSIVALFAAAGAAVALALQGSLSNLASGIIIILTKPFSHGDYIAGGGSEGTVDSIDLLYTTIVTADNKIINIPNSSLTNSTITNWTKAGTRRLDIKIGVSYDSDLEKAKEVLKNIAKETGYYDLDKELSCNVVEYSDSSIILLLRGWVGAPAYWPATFAVNNAIKPAFDKAGITIPYPQLDVHSKND